MIVLLAHQFLVQLFHQGVVHMGALFCELIKKGIAGWSRWSLSVL